MDDMTNKQFEFQVKLMLKLLKNKKNKKAVKKIKKMLKETRSD